MDEYVKHWIVKTSSVGMSVDDIESFHFSAHEGRAYSTRTVEDFTCWINYQLKSGDTGTVYLGESDVVNFLNGYEAFLVGR